MDASSTDLSVISDNIANENTVGFKSSSVAFGDVLSETLNTSSGTSQVGRGVEVSSVAPVFTQGSFETTTNPLDLAINGNGFFIVNQDGSNCYTRAGQFSLDKNGNIVDPNGDILQGYLADASGNITGTTGNLTIPTSQSTANATTTAAVSVNLDATATPPANPFTLGTPPTTPANYNYSNTISVYDSQGGEHAVTQYFVNTGPNAWTVEYVTPDPANPGQLLVQGTQDLTFGNNGSLTNDNSTTPINFNFGGNVTNPQPITFTYGNGTGETPAGNGLDGTTQFASAFSVTSVNQDGYASGSLSSVAVGTDGTITGTYTNGQTETIGQIALANFAAPTALTKLGNNLFGVTSGSGQPLVSAPSTSGLGTVLSDTLELSNVDLASEFTSMIIAQRSFEANSKVITTTDELLQALVSLIT
jgi:flagellar hook protein FlgE